MSRFYAYAGKRWFDFILSSAGLVILTLPMLMIGLIIVVVDGPPVLFRQERVGRNGRLFRICKFRTMSQRLRSGSSITVAGDTRVTPLGRVLRRFKLDELPQLWNVMKGEMSFVGPRPDVPGYVDQLRGDARRLLEHRPGITGPATLAFRDEEKLLARASDPQCFNDEIIFPEKVRLNLAYIQTQSLRGDLACILKTILGR